MWIERFILNQAEKKLQPYRLAAETYKEKQSTLYQEYEPKIAALYQRATHWHGTGRYHYAHTDDSRYSAVNLDTTVDILAGIIEANGLKPHHDPWINSGGKTVSLATVRMHARAFARIHAPSTHLLGYELGSIKFWLRLYFFLLFVWLSTNLWTHRMFIRDTIRTSFSKDIQNWASAIRKPIKGNVLRITDMFKGEIPTSDIVDNYPILIGIATNSDSLIETIPLTHKVEKRSLQPITLSQFTHLEVPLAKVVETEALLQTLGVDVPVIPFEFGDIYLAEEALSALAFS